MARTHFGTDGVRGIVGETLTLELGSGAAGVAADEHATAPGPQRHRAADALDQLGRQRLAHDAAHAVGAEPLPAARSASGKPRVRL